MNKELKQLFEEFNEKPVAYNRVYSKITGSITAGLLLSQLVYWSKAMGYNEFYKTDKDFSDELGMSVKEIRGAKNKLKKQELVDVKVKGVPAKSYYTVNIEKIIKIITESKVKTLNKKQTEKENNRNSSLYKRDKLVCTKRANKNRQKGQTITENTTENTTDIIADKSAGNEINLLLKEFEEVNPTINYGNKTQRKSLEYLVKKFGYQKTLNTIKFAMSVQGNKYAPTITTPLQLKNKLGDLLVFYKKEKETPMIVKI